MKLFFIFLVLGFHVQSYAAGTSAFSESWSAKFYCSWGNQADGGGLQVLQSNDGQRAKVLIEKHFPSADFVETQTGWYEGPVSTLQSGVYIIGNGNRLLLEPSSKGTLTFPQLSVIDQSCVWSTVP